MKYAITDPYGGILNVSATMPVFDAKSAANLKEVEITDEQAEQIAAGRESKTPVFYFLVEGKLVTMEAQMQVMQRDRLRERARKPGFKISKLALSALLKKAGLFKAYTEFISDDPEVLWAYHDATYLQLDNPLVVEMLPAFQQLLGKTENEVIDILAQCRY